MGESLGGYDSSAEVEAGGVKSLWGVWRCYGEFHSGWALSGLQV